MMVISGHANRNGGTSGSLDFGFESYLTPSGREDFEVSTS